MYFRGIVVRLEIPQADLVTSMVQFKAIRSPGKSLRVQPEKLHEFACRARYYNDKVIR